jgi:outer membrane usher protein
MGLGFSLAFGNASSASAGATMNGGDYASSLSVAKTALRENDYGYLLQDSEGADPTRSAEGEYIAPWGRISAGVDQFGNAIAGRAALSGALVWMGGRVFASNQISDSFALVTTGGVAGVPVLYENRLLGVTDSAGELLVPSLLSYQNNLLAVDSSRLPPDIDVGQTSVTVRPPDRSGVVVDFRVRKVASALMTLVDLDGQPVPIGSTAKVDGAKDQPVGYEGQVYVTGLKPTNRVMVVLPDGKSCFVQFAYQPVKGDIPVIGPLTCQ